MTEYDSEVLGIFSLVGMAAGIGLIILGIVCWSLVRSSGKTPALEWIVLGGLTIPAAWIFSFPLSNRDHPLTWLLVTAFVWGAGLGTGLIMAALTPRG